jgi:uncharacterized membrane-anchored protein
MPTETSSPASKIAQVTIWFWVIKLCATVMGETGGDLLSKPPVALGYGLSSIIYGSFFVAALIPQLYAKRYHPFLYWTVILSTLTAGTTLSDFMDRSLHLGYTVGAAILFSLLMLVLAAWWFTERSLSVSNIGTRRAEIFYWTAILVSNTLGTALGDFMADKDDGLGLGFKHSALIVGSALALTALLYLVPKISRVALFWVAFILTRPFGATMGDVLARDPDEGGLGWGTLWPSLALLAVCLVVIVLTSRRDKRNAAEAPTITPNS